MLQVSRQEAATELLRRRRARTGLHDFITYLNPDYIVSDFSLKVCAELDAFLRDLVSGERPIIIFGAPPQHGKSDMVSRYFPAFAFGKYPDLRIAGLSYAMGLASNMNRDVQRIMMSEEYKVLFPDTRLSERRVVTVETQAKRNSEEFEIVGRRGAYVGQGVGGPLTGKRVDLGIIDDPIKNAQEALSERIKDGVWSWYVSTFITRLSKNSGQIIMATRWAMDDLSGRVAEAYPRAKVLTFPAIDDDGNALVPGLHPIDKLRETEETLGDYFWSAMYQQRPIPSGGGVCKPGNIEVVGALPAGLRPVRGWDLAASDGKGDWTVGAKLAVKDGITYICDVVRLRGGPEEVERTIVNTARADDCVQSIPQDPGQAGKAQARYLSTKLQGISFEFTPESGDKTTRASPLAAQINVGNVKMLRADWNNALTQELAAFPNGAHDDQVDALSRAYNKAIGSRYTLDNL